MRGFVYTAAKKDGRCHYERDDRGEYHSDHQSSRAGVMVEVSYAEMLLGGWEIGATRRACDAYSHGVQ
jgi:hypothetical protein